MNDKQNRYRQSMRNSVQKWTDFTDSQWDQFSHLFTMKSYQTREFVTQPSDTTPFVYFVAEGLVRFYYLEDEGEESDKMFSTAGTFVRAVTASILGLPYGSQALEPSVVFLTSFDRLAALAKTESAFGQFDRKLTEFMLLAKDRHVWSLQNLAAADRVLDFSTRFPELASRVPQYHIASYLGMSPVSYSRLKKSSSAPT